MTWSLPGATRPMSRRVRVPIEGRRGVAARCMLPGVAGRVGPGSMPYQVAGGIPRTMALVITHHPKEGVVADIPTFWYLFWSFYVIFGM